MRTQEVIVDEYNTVRFNRGYSKLHWRDPEYIKMEKRMQALRMEYVETLEPDKRLAVQMHNMLCNIQPAWQCPFEDEINGTIDNWEGKTHKAWLKKAQDAINTLAEAQSVDSVTAAETLKQILNILSRKEKTNE